MKLPRLTAGLAASALACAALLLAASAAPAALPVQPGSFAAGSYAGEGTGKYAPLGAGAAADSRAGAHPFMAATSFDLVTRPVRGGTMPFGSLRDAVVQLPAGFVGDPTAAPRCPPQLLWQRGYCPNESAVGLVYVSILIYPFGGNPPTPRPSSWFSLPVFNLEPPAGEPALLGFYNPNPSFTTLIHFSLDPARNYAINASVRNASGLGTVYSSKVAIWGVPKLSDHDRWRGFGSAGPGTARGPGCLFPNPSVDSGPSSYGSCPSTATALPFLSNPGSCDGQPVLTRIALDSWQASGRFDADGNPDLSDPNWTTDVAEAPPVEACGELAFGGPAAPVTLGFQPSLRSADTPSGYRATLRLPYSRDPERRANPTLRDTVVTLPEGVVVNPSSANGLGACTSEEIGLATEVGAAPIRFDGQPARCPDSSKIGTVEVKTPLIDHSLDGAVYLARQFDNPFRSLLAIYIVVEDPQTGTIVKLPGRVEADPVSGRLKTTFRENPQLPFTDLDLDLFGGDSASLINPLTCGTKATASVLTPSSAPDTPAVSYSDSFEIQARAGGTCPAGEAGAPNSPSFEAGTAFTNAASYSPFVLKLRREDGSQRLRGISLDLPPGLTGKLAGVPYCSEAQIAQAASRSRPGEGRLEEAGPSCPAASQVGTVTVGAGAGAQPFHTGGFAYLAGPYRGAPLSLVVVTPAVAGPFDLGTVVVRTALRVDQETARISAVSDPLPTIIEGIPLDVRSVVVSLDRSEFTRNPSNCEAMSITGTATSAAGAVAPLSNRFQVGGCRGLEFEPRLSLRLFGKTNRNAKPRLRAVLQMKSGEANISRAQVNLPHSAFLEQGHIKTICTRVQWAEGNGNGSACPPGSIYGRAKAWTPLLDEPLEGPVYLRANGGERRLPDVVAALNGQVQVSLWGKVDTGPNKGIRNTFEVVPDAPVSKFLLEMRGGKKGLLVNSENLCSPRAKTDAIVRFNGQNGKVSHYKAPLRNDCRKHRKASRKHPAQVNSRGGGG